MSAASYSQEVLQQLLKEIREFERKTQRNETFLLAQSDFNEWLRVWKMTIPEGGRASKDLFVFQKKTKGKFIDLVENEIRDLKSVKVSFEMKIKFTKENFETGLTQEMEHYFKEKEPHVFNEHNKQQIKQEFDRFIETAKGQIEAWSERGSGWVLERIMAAYLNVARYQPLKGGTYLPLPANLANKKAIINVRNRDNECLKWALRAALFPPRDGKNLQRTSKYPVNDGINYEGIVFPTPVKQIDKLEAQNINLAINVFGWEDNRVIVHRISKKEKTIPRINFILIESEEIQHYCYVKRVSALLFDQSKRCCKKHFCMMCLTGFSRADLLENHEKYCNGMNGRPTRIEMPEDGENTLFFQNHNKQMRAPYVIYADFEALIRKIEGRERGPESKQKSYTEKTEKHEACGFAYTVVRSDGRNKRPVVYRGENAVEVFLNCLQEEEKTIRNSLSLPKPLVMTSEDWVKFKNATDCHICEKSLIKDYFLDSLPVWEIEQEYAEPEYCGQSHKKCFYTEKKKHFYCEYEQKYYNFFLKRLTEEEDKEDAQKQENCFFCGKPLLQKNFRDVVKDHCHITGKYRGAAHNACNLKMRIKPKTDQIPVVFHNLRGYDAHHLMQAMSKLSQATQKEVKCVANNMEKYITFSFGGLRFIDSLNFLQGSLDSLVSATPKESLKITKVISKINSEKNAEFGKKSENHKKAEIEKNAELLYKKGVYPYEYMDSWERFEETSLPDKKKFYSKLNDEHITDEEYEHAKSVWKTFGCETLGDYHDLRAA
ncbi:hypothetical protein ACROYT_G035828 [Oculina patagonica]